MNYYYKFIVDTPYAGTEEVFYKMYTGERPTIDYLDNEAEEFCRANAEGYEYLTGGWGCEPDEDDLAIYYDDCSCYWEEITEQEYFEEC